VHTDARLDVVDLGTAVQVRSHLPVQMLGSMLYGFVFAYVTSFGQAFLLGTFILLPVKERSSGAKHCQLISGVLPSVYWLTMFSTDLATFVLPSLGVVGVVVAFDVEPFAHAHNVWWVDDRAASPSAFRLFIYRHFFSCLRRCVFGAGFTKYLTIYRKIILSLS